MRPHIRAHAVANEVRMLRTRHKGALLIVEGATDKRVLRNVVDENACRIVIAHGHENALTATQILEAEKFQGVLTILDADFSRLESDPKPSGNVALTDLHDLECMMVASPAFGKLLGEFVDAARLESFESRMGSTLAETLARNAMPLGYLRWISLRRGLDLRFEELAFHKFVERDTLRIDLRKLILTVRDHSHRQDIAGSFLEEQVTEASDSGHDPWQVCCGHDLLDILSFALRHTVAGFDAHEVKRDILERELRLAYESNFFQQSDLARAIHNWHEVHRPYRILPAP